MHPTDLFNIKFIVFLGDMFSVHRKEGLQKKGQKRPDGPEE